MKTYAEAEWVISWNIGKLVRFSSEILDSILHHVDIWIHKLMNTTKFITRIPLFVGCGI